MAGLGTAGARPLQRRPARHRGLNR